jgi:2-polyprenyl-3-methyl-5-hydroxy-6-metoxy-1,4-benzoquinol methylase
MTKKYIYANLTIKNSSFFKRLSHKKRFQKALDLVKLSDTFSLLDFGTGDGYFLTLLKQKTNASIVGYEPIADMFEQLENTISNNNNNIGLIDDLKKTVEKFDIVYCLEVLEHFSSENQSRLLNQIKDKLKEQGKIIISVPVEVGFGSFIKNILRISIKQVERDTNTRNIFKALFYKPVKRAEEKGYIFSHIGFNYKKLEKVFVKENLQILKKEYSPFNFLRSLNSQIFYVLEYKTKDC